LACFVFGSFGCLDTRPRRPCVCIPLGSLSADPSYTPIPTSRSGIRISDPSRSAVAATSCDTYTSLHSLTADSLSALFAVFAGVFVTFLLFAFECGPMSMEWPNGGGVEQCRGGGTRSWVSGVASCAFVTNSRQLNFTHNALSANSPFDLSTRQRQRQRQLQLKPRGRSIQVSSILR